MLRFKILHVGAPTSSTIVRAAFLRMAISRLQHYPRWAPNVFPCWAPGVFPCWAPRCFRAGHRGISVLGTQRVSVLGTEVFPCWSPPLPLWCCALLRV